VGQKYCSNCKQVTDHEHKCFILTQDQIDKRDIKWLNKRKHFSGFIFWDIEATADENNDGEHVVNLVMAQRVCVECLDEPDRCESCLPQIKYKTIADWVDFMLCRDNENYTRQMYPRNALFLIDAYDDATKNNYGYLLIDLHQKTNEKLRIQSDIFGTRFVYQPK
jgi:hypothetical protein